MARLARTVATLAALLLLTTSCSQNFNGLADLPLPGGVDLGPDPVTLTVESSDVLNLAVHSTVKVDDVTVGEVMAIDRVGWTALITLKVRRDVPLPANTVAAIRQTGLLGEKYVELAPPPDQRARGSLTSGTRIPLSHSTRSFEVEEVLSSLSLLLNGGGLENLKTITVELHQALQGREDDFRELLGEIDDFTGTLAASRRQINAALSGLDDLSATLRKGDPTIARALDRLGPAVTVLADQRAALVEMLTSLSRLSPVAVRTVSRVRADLLADLRALRPTLSQLAAAGNDIPRSLKFLLSYPFPDSAMSAVKGDYVNFDARYHLSLADLLRTAGISKRHVGGSLGGGR